MAHSHTHKKAPDNAGAFELLGRLSLDQYLAGAPTPLQLNR
jgi:hypothetical protein